MRGVSLRGAAIAATLVVLAPIAWFWQQSRLPATYSVMDMGYVDTGGGPPAMDMGAAHDRSVTELVADPARRADVRVTLTVRQERFRLASGHVLDGYTVNGTSPGPTIRAAQGDLVEVRLVNASVPGGATLHWHGVDVPNASDGVAGVTQDAVQVGHSFVYRFVAEDAGTYWYHSHQVSHEQVQGGLLGALVVTPREPAPEVVEVVALLHVYGGMPTVNGLSGEMQVPASAGSRVRLRVINTDNGVAPLWTSSAYRVLAVDGREVHQPTAVTGKAFRLTAGARVDLEVTAPARVELGGANAVEIGAGAAPLAQPSQVLDLLGYGSGHAARVRPAPA